MVERWSVGRRVPASRYSFEYRNFVVSECRTVLVEGAYVLGAVMCYRLLVGARFHDLSRGRPKKDLAPNLGLNLNVGKIKRL
jgi:hypothetical protein